MTLTGREHQVVALLRGNPLLGSQAIAARLGMTRAAVNVHLSNLSKKGVILGRGYVLAESPGVVVIGGANMDIKARSADPAAMGTSNPGHSRMSAGGVGRNVAANLARLGTRTYLVAGVGRDSLGDTIVRETSDAGVHLDYLARTEANTGTYTAVLDHDGELVLAVSDMAATEELSPASVAASRDVLAASEFVILDGNLHAETARYARDLAADAGVRIIIEPVSVAKARHLAQLDGLLDSGQPLFAVTPNRDELAAMTGLPVESDAELRAALRALHERGVEYVWVRLGARGSWLSGPDGIEELASAAADVIDVTGAGDSLLAGFCHALLSGADPAEAARFGHATAALTIASNQTVRDDLTDRLVRDSLTTMAVTPTSPSAVPSTAAAPNAVTRSTTRTTRPSATRTTMKEHA